MKLTIELDEAKSLARGEAIPRSDGAEGDATDAGGGPGVDTAPSEVSSDLDGGGPSQELLDTVAAAEAAGASDAHAGGEVTPTPMNDTDTDAGPGPSVDTERT